MSKENSPETNTTTSRRGCLVYLAGMVGSAAVISFGLSQSGPARKEQDELIQKVDRLDTSDQVLSKEINRVQIELNTTSPSPIRDSLSLDIKALQTQQSEVNSQIQSEDEVNGDQIRFLGNKMRTMYILIFGATSSLIGFGLAGYAYESKDLHGAANPQKTNF